MAKAKKRGPSAAEALVGRYIQAEEAQAVLAAVSQLNDVLVQSELRQNYNATKRLAGSGPVTTAVATRLQVAFNQFRTR